MKYLWIIMLAVIDIIWIIASVIEFIRALKAASGWNHESFFDWVDNLLSEVEDYATGCLFTHLFILFIASLVMFVAEHSEVVG